MLCQRPGLWEPGGWEGGRSQHKDEFAHARQPSPPPEDHSRDWKATLSTGL